MILDYTISVGSILQTVVIAAAAVAAFYSMRSDINVLKHDMKNLQENQKTLTEAFRQLGQVLTSIAVQDNRLIMLEKHLDELKHGKGLIH